MSPRTGDPMAGRTVLVTGAAGVIGSAVARAFAELGAGLSLCDTDADGLVALAASVAGTRLATSSIVDVRNAAEVRGWVERTIAEQGGADVLVNVAGVRSVGSAADLAEEEWDRVVDINLKGTFLCCQAVMPTMKAQGSGRIINIGSILAKNGGNARPWIDPAEQQTSSNVAYSSAKAGVHVMTIYLARELAGFGITVNAVAPGPVESVMTAQSPASRRRLVPLGRYAEPEEIADAVIFLAGPGAGYITGEILDVNGGFWCD